MNAASKPVFWRDSRMPYVELRRVEDGRDVCYALHSHTQWSLGAITKGKSSFHYRNGEYQVGAGDLVLMNPEWVHACNPIDNQPWAYMMMYVDAIWLTNLRYQEGLLHAPCWQDISTNTISDDAWYRRYCRVADCLLDSKRDLLDKQTVVVQFLSDLMHQLSSRPAEPLPQTPEAVKKLVAYLDSNAAEEVSLDELCACSGYSPGHLIRAFKQYCGLTPHAYLINRRVQLAQSELKSGKTIAEAALNAGFAVNREVNLSHSAPVYATEF